MPAEVVYDRHYRESEAACGSPFHEFLAFAEAHAMPGIRVLDLGCGQGRDALLFARRGCSVVGVDASAVGVGQLRAVAEREGLELEAAVADLLEYQPSGAFDVVILDRVLHMLASDEARLVVLGRAIEALAPGGALLVADEPKRRDAIRRAMTESGLELTVDTKNRTFGRRPA